MCLDTVLTELKGNRFDTLAISVEGQFIEVPESNKINLTEANEFFFNNITKDTMIYLIKIFPIRVINNYLVVGIGYFNYKLTKNNWAITPIENYFFYFEYSCNSSNYALKRVERLAL
jgi:hypothetical protein